ncbi:MAG TPA: SRPBCC domain-containing protein [Dehalococcoidia bacterium]|nr:SRPBCC domain-containing protein [Dehalococcoidia bacterium]
MDILHSVPIKTTPEHLFEAITTEAGLAAWWTPDTSAEPRVGGLNTFGFGPGLSATFRVDVLEPQRHVAWSAMKTPPIWEGTGISFSIAPGDGAVALRFSHTGYANDEPSFGLYNYLWAQYIRSLKLLLETGTGEPFGSPGSNAAHPLP